MSLLIPTQRHICSCYCGAKVTFVDIQEDGDRQTHCPEMDYEKLERAIAEHTKAIILVDLVRCS